MKWNWKRTVSAGIAFAVVLSVFMFLPMIQAEAASSMDYHISENGIRFICDREGFSPTCFKDYSQSSIGYGTKCTGSPEQPHEAGLHTITREAALKEMREQISNRFEGTVREQTFGLSMTQNQFDALVSLCYNCGGGSDLISKSPLVQYLKGMLTEEEARSKYSSYIIRADGDVLEGLIDRRNREADLFFSADEDAAVEICQGAYDGYNYYNSSLSNVRIQVLDEAKRMACVQWKAPCTFVTWRSAAGRLCTVKDTNGISSNSFLQGRTYQGIPYSMADNTYTYEKWVDALEKGKVTEPFMSGMYSKNHHGNTTLHGIDAATFVYTALKTVCPSLTCYTTEQMTSMLSKSGSVFRPIGKSELRGGDLLLKNGHVMLFVGKSAAGKYCVFQCTAGGMNEKVSGCCYSEYSEGQIAGYTPVRCLLLETAEQKDNEPYRNRVEFTDVTDDGFQLSFDAYRCQYARMVVKSPETNEMITKSVRVGAEGERVTFTFDQKEDFSGKQEYRFSVTVVLAGKGGQRVYDNEQYGVEEGLVVLPGYNGHEVAESYGTDFSVTAPRVIRVFDYTHTIDQKHWLRKGTECTILEVYTDGCCKVEVPSESQTYYARFSEFFHIKTDRRHGMEECA